jgi:hypothetical protein
LFKKSTETRTLLHDVPNSQQASKIAEGGKSK